MLNKSLWFGWFLSGCLEQYDPTSHHQQIANERVLANREMVTLTADGRLPEKVVMANGEPAANQNPSDEKFASFCASCHGKEGKGDGPAALAMNPKPRNFSDHNWQKTVSDEHLAKVIKDGGSSVGLSPMMAAWGSMLKEEEVTALVAKIRAMVKE